MTNPFFLFLSPKPALPRAAGRIWPILVCAWFAISSLALGQPIVLHYDFNKQAGTDVADLSGKSHPAEIQAPGIAGSDKSGVSGQTGDFAFDNTASPMGVDKAHSGGSIDLPVSFGSLSSFTITMWYKGDGQELTQGTRFFEVSGRENGLLLLGVNNFKSLIFCDGKQVLANGKLPLPNAEEWTFLAITFDGSATSGNVQIYVGGAKEAASSFISGNYGGGPIDWGQNSKLVFGANSSNGRCYSGLMDNIRMYADETGGAGALSLEQIEAIRAKEAENLSQ